MEYKVGDFASITKVITDEDIITFSKISGDTNPVHLNEEYAKTTIFKTRIAHGMYVASFISTVLGTQLPGPGSIYIGQEVAFVKPVYINDTITTKVEIESIDERRNAKIKTICFNQNNENVIVGSAIIKLPRE